MSRRIVLCLISIAAVAGLVVLYAFNPAESSFFPKCPFFWLTGLKCPGCGSLRATHQLLHLHIGKALGYNALMVVCIPLLLFLIVSDALKAKFPRLYLLGRNPILSWSVVALVFLWWILRNIFNV